MALMHLMVFLFMLISILAFILIISILVFVHEGGHFLTARLFGVKVEEFGFGFPPRIKGYKRKDTVYSINWLPLGGFVKIKGEQGEAQNDIDSFASRKIWQRALMIFAGVAMNFILAALIFSIGFIIGIPGEINNNLGSGAIIHNQKVEIFTVIKDSAADKIGITPKDSIVSVGGVNVFNAKDASNKIREHIGKKAQIGFTHNDIFQTAEAEIGDIPGYDEKGLGVELIDTGTVSYPWYLAFWEGTKEMIITTKEIVFAFYDLFKGLIVGADVAADVAGPIGIAVITAKFVRLGFVYLLQFTAIISINLAIINLLPFPALDGGRLIFLAIEKIRHGKKVDQNWENLVHSAGFFILIFLAIIVTWHDIVNFGGVILSHFGF